jgi:hypothetical protein
MYSRGERFQSFRERLGASAGLSSAATSRLADEVIDLLIGDLLDPHGGDYVHPELDDRVPF